MKDYKQNSATFSEEFCRDVYAVVNEIPVGKVMTYGGIARLLGLPQCSRLVGRALKQVPAELSLPCHRVVNAVGRLTPGWDEQRALLSAEGVCFRVNGYVDMRLCLWNQAGVSDSAM